MTLYSPKRSVQKVIDAGFDLSSPNQENINSNEQVGFTTRIVQHAQSNNPSISGRDLYRFHYQSLIDRQGRQPSQDGVTLGLDSNGRVEVQISSGNAFSVVTDVKLKHYINQLQSILGYGGVGSINLGTTSPGSPAELNIVPVYDGAGNYRQFDFRLGHARGFKYSENSNGIWPSSANPPSGVGERLQSTGEICIGTAI